MPEMQIYIKDFWVPSALALLLIVASWIYLVLKAHQRKVQTGIEGLRGERGEYRGDGLVHVHGELWKAESSDQLNRADVVEVIEVNNLKLKVRKVQ